MADSKCIKMFQGGINVGKTQSGKAMFQPSKKKAPSVSSKKVSSKKGRY